MTVIDDYVCLMINAWWVLVLFHSSRTPWNDRGNNDSNSKGWTSIRSYPGYIDHLSHSCINKDIINYQLLISLLYWDLSESDMATIRNTLRTLTTFSPPLAHSLRAIMFLIEIHHVCTNSRSNPSVWTKSPKRHIDTPLNILWSAVCIPVSLQNGKTRKKRIRQ